jgi:hypothetical protein
VTHVVTIIRKPGHIVATCSCGHFKVSEGRNKGGDYFAKRLEASIRAHEMQIPAFGAV